MTGRSITWLSNAWRLQQTKLVLFLISSAGLIPAIHRGLETDKLLETMQVPHFSHFGRFSELNMFLVPSLDTTNKHRADSVLSFWCLPFLLIHPTGWTFRRHSFIWQHLSLSFYLRLYWPDAPSIYIATCYKLEIMLTIVTKQRLCTNFCTLWLYNLVCTGQFPDLNFTTVILGRLQK